MQKRIVLSLRITRVDWMEDFGVLRRRGDREGYHAAPRRSRAEMRGAKELSSVCISYVGARFPRPIRDAATLLDLPTSSERGCGHLVTDWPLMVAVLGNMRHIGCELRRTTLICNSINRGRLCTLYVAHNPPCNVGCARRS
jgi:hypothetical protein